MGSRPIHSYHGAIAVSILPAVLDDAPAILELQRNAYRSEAVLYNDWSIPPLTQTLAQRKR
jgi:hypothetical protein